VLTSGGDRWETPDFEEGQTGGWPWWPARCSADWGAPADLRRRETAQHVRLGVLELLAALVSSGCTPMRRIDGELDSAQPQGQRRTVGRRQRGGALGHAG
jgi:hypothetical protein